jgi:hypothetical protein
MKVHPHHIVGTLGFGLLCSRIYMWNSSMLFYINSSVPVNILKVPISDVMCKQGITHWEKVNS